MSTQVRLQRVEGSSSKFWELVVTGTKLTTTWGRIGTAGQSKTFASSVRASLEGKKLHAEKTAKGYRPTTTTAARSSQDVRATQDELRGLGVAMAVRSKRPVSPRFRLGLDAADEPAVLLLGNGLVAGVYGHKKPRT